MVFQRISQNLLKNLLDSLINTSFLNTYFMEHPRATDPRKYVLGFYIYILVQHSYIVYRIKL